MKLRSATAADITFIMDLERASPTAAHWTEAQYRQVVQPGGGDPERFVLVAEAVPSPDAREGSDSISRILGFLIARHVAAEWELENIVVAPAARREGLGKQLLDGLLARAEETNSEAVFLEVRESNTAARSLYQRAGFHQIGRRKSYYANPDEDAILYRRVLRAPFSQ